MTSTVGLIGNFGQANYMAAKLGIVGLSRAIAMDLQHFYVRSNCIAPFAWSRMVSSIPTETEADKVRVAKLKQTTPEKVAPMVIFLESDAAKSISSQIFAVRNNEVFLMSQSRLVRALHPGAGWTAEALAAELPEYLGGRLRRSNAPRRCAPGIRFKQGTIDPDKLLALDIPSVRQTEYLI